MITITRKTTKEAPVNPVEPDEYLSTGEVAKVWGVTAETVRSWIKTGRLDAIVTPSGRFLVHRDAAVRPTPGRFRTVTEPIALPPCRDTES